MLSAVSAVAVARASSLFLLFLPARCKKLCRILAPELLAPRGPRRLQPKYGSRNASCQHRRKHSALRRQRSVAVEGFLKSSCASQSITMLPGPVSKARSPLRRVLRPESRSDSRCRRCSAARARALHRQTAHNRAAEPAARPVRRPAYPRDENSRPPEHRARPQSPAPRPPARCRQTFVLHTSPRAPGDRASAHGIRQIELHLCFAAVVFTASAYASPSRQFSRASSAVEVDSAFIAASTLRRSTAG